MPRDFPAGKVVAFDTESTGTRPYHGHQPFAFSFCNEEGEKAYFEFPVDPFTRKVEYDSRIKRIKRYLEDDTITKVMHHAKFDVRMCDVACGIKIAGPGGFVGAGGKLHDTMFMAHCCNTDETNYKLKDLSVKYLDYPRKDQEDLKKCVSRCRRWAKPRGWNLAWEVELRVDKDPKRKAVPEADYWLPRAVRRVDRARVSKKEARLCKKYALSDAERTILLHMCYMEVMDDYDCRETYEREMALWPQVYVMEDRGVAMSRSRLKTELDACIERYRFHRDTLTRKYGWKGINLDSAVDQRKLFYEKWKIPITKRTKTGLPSVDKEVMREHMDQPVVQHMVKYRSANKAYGTFFYKYWLLSQAEKSKSDTILIHADFRQIGPTTGRFSCADPNMQQVPSHETSAASLEPIAARVPFGPRPGYVWISSDYKGQEIRVFADVAQEPRMLKVINSGGDVHSLVCSSVYDGEGNPLGLKQAVAILELGGHVDEAPDEKLAKAWKELGIRRPSRYSQKDREKIADEWLEQFKWCLEHAEKSVGRKKTKNRAKMLSFLNIYGGGVKAAAKTMLCEVQEVKDTLRTYHREFPRVREYLQELSKQARKDGCIWTRWNRRITIDPEFAYRCVNYMVQGTSADLLKHGMRQCGLYFLEEGIDGYVVMPIHDELVFEIRRAQATLSLVRALDARMSNTEGRLTVPITTDPYIIPERWDKKFKIRGYRYAA